jgi:hypothetical protein
MACLPLSLKASILSKTTTIQCLSKSTQFKTQLTQGVVNSFNSSYTLQSRAMVIQQKTDRPVQFEITKGTRETLAKHIKRLSLRATDYLF